MKTRLLLWIICGTFQEQHFFIKISSFLRKLWTFKVFLQFGIHVSAFQFWGRQSHKPLNGYNITHTSKMLNLMLANTYVCFFTATVIPCQAKVQPRTEDNKITQHKSYLCSVIPMVDLFWTTRKMW